MEDDGEYPASVILPALRLARERVTGEDPEAKELRRNELAVLAECVGLYHDKSEAEGRPTAQELRDALGDPDDGDLRKALAAWE